MASDLMPCGHKNGKNLVVCIDGTSNQFGVKNTNVIELYNLILKDVDQRTWYNSGIGTYARPSWKSLKHYKKVLYHKIDLAIAWGFEKTVLAAYRWLSDNYEKGDCIFLFGFSRGAYQVRVLSAMIDKVGLIYKGNEVQIPFAYELYADLKSGEASVTQVGQIGSQDVSMAQRFKNAFSHKDVKVHFIGAWDTVSSIGIIRGKKMLPGTVDGMTHVCYFRHALALDERRVKFLPEYAYGGTSIPREKDDETNMHKEDVKHPQANARSQVVERLDKRQQTMEVWFAGTHSDIGGGNTENVGMDRRKPPLRWIVFEARAAGLRTDKMGRNFLSEQKIEFRESLKWYWWTLEVLPFKRLTFTRQEDGMNQITYKPHLGSSRKIQPGQKIHSSLLLTDEMSTSYTPKARPLDDHPLFWEVLREEGFHSKWLEVDLHKAIRPLIEDSIAVTNGSASRHLNKIATSDDGLQAIYDIVLYDLSTRDAKVQHQLLAFLILILKKRKAQLELKPSVEVRPLLSKLLTGNEKYRKTAQDFLESFSDRNRWEVDLYNATEIEIDFYIGNSKAVILSKIAASGGDGQNAIYEQVIKVLDTSDVEVQYRLLRLSIDLFKENSRYYAQLKLRPFVEVRSSVSKLSESIKEEHQKTAQEFLIYFTDWSEWLGDDLDKVIHVVIGNLIAGNRTISLSILIKIATSGVGRQALYDKMIEELNARYPVQQKLLSAMLKVFERNSQDDAQLVLKRSVDVRPVLLPRWETNRGYRSPAREFLKELTDPCIDVMDKETSQIVSVTFSFDDEYLALFLKDGTIRLRNAKTKEETVEGPFQGHKVAVESVAISFDRRFIALHLDDGTIRVWNAETKEVVGQPLQVPRNTVNSVAVSSDGRSVASGSHDGIQIWNVAIAEEGEQGQGLGNVVNTSGSRDKLSLSLEDSHDRTVRNQYLATPRILEGHESAAECLAFSLDGKYIVSGSRDGRIRIWDARTGSPVGRSLEGHRAAVISVAFSPDGLYIVSGSADEIVKIWDGTGSPVGRPLEGHKAAVNSVAFSPDRQYIVSGSEDKTVRIWDAKRGRLVGRPFQGHTASIQSVSFSDDGKRIVSESWDKGHMTVRTWDAETVVVTERRLSFFHSLFLDFNL